MVTRFGKKNITSVDYGFNEIDLHSEASFAPSWPVIIWFYCITPTAGEGGATTLCDGSVLWKKLSTKAKTFFLTNPIKTLSMSVDFHDFHKFSHLTNDQGNS